MFNKLVLRHCEIKAKQREGQPDVAVRNKPSPWCMEKYHNCTVVEENRFAQRQLINYSYA